MTDANLPNGAPGSYVPYGARPYYLPEPLPPETEVDVGSDRREVIENAIYELGRLEGVSEVTDTNPLVYTPLVRREAAESVLIELLDDLHRQLLQGTQHDAPRQTS